MASLSEKSSVESQNRSLLDSTELREEAATDNNLGQIRFRSNEAWVLFTTGLVVEKRA